MDLLDLFDRGTKWIATKVAGAKGKLDDPTPCHEWDLAKATGQDTKMPEDLAEAAFQMIDGRMTDDQRGTFFKPPVKVADDASAQDKLLAYGGRDPN